MTFAGVDRSPDGRRAAPFARDRSDRPLESEIVLRERIDWARAVLAQRRGRSDPTMTTIDGIVWRAARTPEGVATLALREVSAGRIRTAAWGPGREWATEQAPALIGARDDPTGFDPSEHPLLAATHRRRPGLRLGRTDLIFDALVQSIIEQKVTAIQAFSVWRRIVARFGERAPGPTPRPLFAPPSVDGWRHVPSWSWHRAGLEPPQARTVVGSARHAASVTAALAHTHDGASRDRVLTSLPGVGLWTAAETRIRALGDPDAVSVGDYHLAHQVGFALTGHRVEDEGMLALLAPWTGHRQRVIALIAASGASEPRRGPRLHPEDHRNR